MIPIPPIKERGFPLALKKLVNLLVRRVNRNWFVSFEDTASAKFVDAEDTVTLVLPRNLGAGTGVESQTKRGFQFYPAPYLGVGTPPVGQALDFQLYYGVINDSIIPDNMGSVFSLDNNSTQYLVCTTNQNAAGTVTSASLSIESTLIQDPTGSLDVAPPTSSRPLWQFTTLDNAISAAVELKTGGFDVIPVAYDVQCGETSVKMFWSATSVSS